MKNETAGHNNQQQPGRNQSINNHLNQQQTDGKKQKISARKTGRKNGKDQQQKQQ